MFLALSVSLLGCPGDPPSETREGIADRPARPGPGAGFVDRDRGQRHPPLPADNPAWDWDAGGFVPDHGWYGEHTWDDVRMRVAGHLTLAARDLSRVHAEAGDHLGAAAVLDELVETLTALDLQDSQVAQQIQGILVASSRRDANLLRGLDAGRIPRPDGDRVAAARHRYLDLALKRDQGTDAGTFIADAESLRADLARLARPRDDLDLDGFQDFESRHRLRVRLFEAAFDVGDPLGLDEPWGYFESVEIQRQVGVLDQSTEALMLGPPPELEKSPAIRWPSLLAEQARSSDQQARFTREGLGWLPTGDTLIDVAGSPGPRAIGTLEKLGLDDMEHAAWLDQKAKELNEALDTGPAEVLESVRAMVATFEAMDHGSRYYNAKQARNEGVRQLARAGYFREAAVLVGEMRPLHNQDWACPNREGILLGLEGRLLAEAGDAEAARQALGAALAAGRGFLDQVDAAEAAPPGTAPGRTPPRVGPAAPSSPNERSPPP